jgi:hypothetical protein
MSAVAAPRPSSSLQRRLVTAFTQHLALKGTALLVTLVLWFTVKIKEPEVGVVKVRFTPQLDSTLVMRDPAPELQAIVAASPDTVVVDLRPDDVTMPDGVDAVVRDLYPRSITLRLEPTIGRRVPVRSALIVSVAGIDGPTSTRFDPESVQVSGPKHLVLQTKWVQTIRGVISFPDSLPHLVDIDTTGFGTLRVKPPQVKVLLAPAPTPKKTR